MYASIGATKVTTVCPVREFVQGEWSIAIHFQCSTHLIYTENPSIKKGADGEPIMYDPLAWWYRQRSAGHERDGMTQMAIDVLSTPGTSQAFKSALPANILTSVKPQVWTSSERSRLLAPSSASAGIT